VTIEPPSEVRASPALELLLRKRGELQALLQRHGVPDDEAPWLVTEALLAVGSDAPESPPHAGRLLRALEVVCTRWAVERAARRARQGAWEEDDDGFGALLRSVARRLDARRNRLRDEEQAAPRLTDELLALAPQRRGQALAEHRFRTWAVVDHLLAAARSLCFEDAHRSLDMALLAGEIAARLDADEYGASALCDLRARVALASANARRILCELDAAEEDFGLAERLLEEGSLDPRLRAEHLRLKAALLRAQRRGAEAGRLLDQAMAIYRWSGETDQQVRVLISRALLAEQQGDFETAVAASEQAHGLLAEAPEDRLHLVVLHNLASHHLRLDHVDQAAELLADIRRLDAAQGGRLDGIRVDWLEGLVRLARSDDGGEDLLRAARDGFVAEELPVDAALVCLDLAAHYLTAGRTAETRQIADEIVPLFRSYRIEREAMAAVLIFQQAARMETATASLAREVASSLRAARERSAAPVPS